MFPVFFLLTISSQDSGKQPVLVSRQRSGCC